MDEDRLDYRAARLRRYLDAKAPHCILAEEVTPLPAPEVVEGEVDRG